MTETNPLKPEHVLLYANRMKTELYVTMEQTWEYGHESFSFNDFADFVKTRPDMAETELAKLAYDYARPENQFSDIIIMIRFLRNQY
jgi:hypothetical protein